VNLATGFKEEEEGAYIKLNKTKSLNLSWKCGSSGEVLAYQPQGPEFKHQLPPKKNPQNLNFEVKNNMSNNSLCNSQV
jgi:hypothetical protein